MHTTLRNELHTVVAHWLVPSSIDGVRSLEPKLVPSTVIDAPLESAVLGATVADRTGASNEKRL